MKCQQIYAQEINSLMDLSIAARCQSLNHAGRTLGRRGSALGLTLSGVASFVLSRRCGKVVETPPHPPRGLSAGGVMRGQCLAGLLARPETAMFAMAGHRWGDEGFRADPTQTVIVPAVSEPFSGRMPQHGLSAKWGSVAHRPGV